MSDRFQDSPPCAQWDAWVGTEIEGQTDLGKKTLFVRRVDKIRGLAKRLLAQKCPRVWFCAEFVALPTESQRLIYDYLLDKVTMVFEVPLPVLFRMAPFLHQYGKLYVKWECGGLLLPGDHVCFGPAFADESFQIGTGNRVVPAQYQLDQEVLL